MKIAFFGSSRVSSYGSGESRPCQGLLKALAGLGHEITFHEPDSFARRRRGSSDPPWAKTVVYPATHDGWQRAVAGAAHYDLLMKASAVGVFDAEIEQALPQVCQSRGLCAFWDMDAPATLDAIALNPAHHLRHVIPRYDLVLASGGGAPLVAGYSRLGARLCVPVYDSLDPAVHFPVRSRLSYRCDLGFLASRLPDCEAGVDAFFMKPATILRHHDFLLGGAGWHDKVLPTNVRCVGHIGTDRQNAFFASSLATLNVNRASMARFGYSPPARLFQAAGAGACLITETHEEIAHFLEPDREVLVAADGEEVAELVANLSPDEARHIAAAARARILAHHTCEHRARAFDALLEGMTRKDEAAA